MVRTSVLDSIVFQDGYPNLTMGIIEVVPGNCVNPWLASMSGAFEFLSGKIQTTAIRWSGVQVLALTLPFDLSKAAVMEEHGDILKAHGGFIEKPYLSALFFAQKA